MQQNEKWYMLKERIVIENISVVEAFNRHPKRSNLSFWVLVLVKKGQRTLYIDDYPLSIGPHEFFLLPPNTKQEPWMYDKHFAYYVHFDVDGESVKAPLHVDASKLILPMVGKLPNDIDCFNFFNVLVKHALSPYSDADFLSLQLRALLSMISLSCQKRNNMDVNTIQAENLLDYIQKNINKSLCAEDYEQFSGKSYRYVNHLFKEHYGCTVKQYHQRVRMEYAAQLMLSGNSVKETAIACGYEDYYFFINSFTKVHGVSPAVYKKNGIKQITIEKTE